MPSDTHPIKEMENICEVCGQTGLKIIEEDGGTRLESHFMPINPLARDKTQKPCVTTTPLKRDFSKIAHFHLI